MPESKNILDLINNDMGAPLETVRINSDETPIVLFTEEYVEASLHYVHVPEIQSYIRCNESGCLLCNIGRDTTIKLLLPVFLPIKQSVAVLPISSAMRPGALLPKLLNIFQSGFDQIVFIRRIDNYTFNVSTKSLPKGADNGAKVIKRFIDEFDSDSIDIKSVYQRLSNEQLAVVPEIKALMDLKEIQLGG